MRIWSIHPKYLDAKGLVALWREALLATHVLEGKTKGYINHAQLKRFRGVDDPAGAICQYLSIIEEEASARGYNFDRNKIGEVKKPVFIEVTTGQLEYERKHLLSKLKIRNPELFNKFKEIKNFDPHPIFVVINGEVEKWEKMLTK